MFIALIALILAAAPADARAQGARGGHDHSRAEQYRDTSGMRFQPGDSGAGDSVRIERDIAFLGERLALDSAQTVYVRNVVRRRGQSLKNLRAVPIKDRDLVHLRMQKIIADADAEIEKVLTDSQRKEYAKIKDERDKLMEERRESRGNDRGGRHGGRPGMGGSPAGGF